MSWRLSVVEQQCVMTGCRFDFTVFLFHRPKMDLKGFLSFTLLHRFQFNQPQWQRNNQTKQPKEITCWTLSQASCCVFLNAPPPPSPLPLCSKCSGSNCLCLNSLHPHFKYLEVLWLLTESPSSHQFLPNHFPFLHKIHKLCWCWNMLKFQAE